MLRAEIAVKRAPQEPSTLPVSFIQKITRVSKNWGAAGCLFTTFRRGGLVITSPTASPTLLCPYTSFLCALFTQQQQQQTTSAFIVTGSGEPTDKKSTDARIIGHATSERQIKRNLPHAPLCMLQAALKKKPRLASSLSQIIYRSRFFLSWG